MHRLLLSAFLLLPLTTGCDQEPAKPKEAAPQKADTKKEADANKKVEATADAKAETKVEEGKAEPKVDEAKAEEGKAEASCDGCMWMEGATAEEQEEMGVSHHTPLPKESGCYRRVQHPHAKMHMETHTCEAKCCPGH